MPSDILQSTHPSLSGRRPSFRPPPFPPVDPAAGRNARRHCVHHPPAEQGAVLDVRPPRVEGGPARPVFDGPSPLPTCLAAHWFLCVGVAASVPHQRLRQRGEGCSDPQKGCPKWECSDPGLGRWGARQCLRSDGEGGPYGVQRGAGLPVGDAAAVPGGHPGRGPHAPGGEPGGVDAAADWRWRVPEPGADGGGEAGDASDDKGAYHA